jgi:predicted Zn-dependent peptidase
MENVGGEINAFTTKEDTCIHTSFMNKFLDRAADLLADITFHSTFPENELEKEKEVVLDEINSYRDNPTEEIFDEFEKLVFANHSIGRYILGEASIIKKFRKQHLLHFMKRCYNTNEIVICSVGNTDFAMLVKIIEKHFSAYTANNRNWKRSKFKGYKPFYTEVAKPIHQSHCMIGNTAYHSKDKRRTQMIMLNNILGGPGMNSKLSMNIREKYGFCYNIESNYTSFSDAGIFSIYFGTEQENIERTISLVHKELDKLRITKLGTLQLQRAKLQLMGQLAIAYESGMNEMLSIGKSVLFFNKVDTIEQINAKIEAVTALQLLETANEIFNRDALSTLIFKSGMNGKPE